MPNLTDWLMVIITGVYVIATIFICVANIKSASASKAQLEEMKRQYKEESRARIEVEFIYVKRSFLALRFVNHGRSAAYDVSITLDDTFLDSINEPTFSALVRKQKDKKCIIGMDQHYDLFFGSNRYLHNEAKVPATGIVRYISDGVIYKSRFSIDLESYMTFFSVTSEQEDLVKAVKDETTVLKKLNNIVEGKRYFYGDYEDDIDV